MPIYEYECTRCASRFDLKQSFSDSTTVTCPQCGCNAQRIFSSVPIIFKGSGFSVTDKRRNQERPSSESGTDETKTDIKDKRYNQERSSPESGTDETKTDSTDKRHNQERSSPEGGTDKTKTGITEKDS